MKTPLQEALQHQQEHKEHLYKFGRDEAKRIQDQSGRDMDISERDAGEPKKRPVATDEIIYPDDKEIDQECKDWNIIEKIEAWKLADNK